MYFKEQHAKFSLLQEGQSFFKAKHFIR